MPASRTPDVIHTYRHTYNRHVKDVSYNTAHVEAYRSLKRTVLLGMPDLFAIFIVDTNITLYTLITLYRANSVNKVLNRYQRENREIFPGVNIRGVIDLVMNATFVL